VVTSKVEISKKEEEVFAVNQPFTKEALERAWRRFAEDIQDDPHLTNAMKAFPPNMLEDYQIEAVIQNQALEAKLLQLKPELERHLHRQLKNGKIRLRLRMAEENENTRPFTARDRLDSMMQKNPHLEKLYRSLGLEI
jgi:hypothetical protein